MANLTSLPLPLHCDPHYERLGLRDLIISFLSKRPGQAIIIPSEPISFDSTPDLERLDVGRIWGLAPWTGRPAHYEWRYAVDDKGRAVATDSYLVHEPLDREILDGR